MKYNFKIGLQHVIKYFVIFALPFLVDQFIVNVPQVAQLTVGAVLVGIVNYLKITIKK